MQHLKRAKKRVARFLGLGDTDEVKGAEVPAAWYNSHYASSKSYAAPYWNSHYYFLWTVIADRLRRQGISSVLDIGCGPGQMATLLLEQGIKTYVGVDFSSTAIEMAKRACTAGRFLVGDARNPQIYLDHDYESLICTEVLEHIENDLAVINAFPANKKCICTVPSFPFDSHVRFFSSEKEVAERFSRFFDSFYLVRFRSPLDQNDWFYLFEGVRNSRTS